MAETGRKGGWSASGELGGGSASPEKRAWPVRGWFTGSGALGKIGDLLQAVLAVWEKDVAGKVTSGECFLTTIRPTGKRFLP